jgi:DNA-binding LacI/PurR family transcriptional regulator
MADGMIMNYTQKIPPRMQALVQGHHTPAVWLNTKLAADCVHPDDRGAAETVTRQLIAAGHRRIAFVHLCSSDIHGSLTFEQARPHLHYSAHDRLEGFRTAMREAGLTPVEAFDNDFVTEAESVAACQALLTRPNRPTAVMLYSEREAPAMVLAARLLGLHVPRDLAILEFYPYTRSFADMVLTAIPIPTEAMGRAAVQMLTKKIAVPDEAIARFPVPYSRVPDEAIVPPHG